MGWGGFLVITVFHPTFCFVGVRLWLRLGLGCDNNNNDIRFIKDKTNGAEQDT